ncbi:MAG: hypothetical protein HY770_09120 [Chitinivibrionia bacterium]|nr:hypothetical protein [Chitinivibrionia bacterium]
MSRGAVRGKHMHHRTGPLESQQDDFERFRNLSYELLMYSTRGLLRKDFLPAVAEKIREHADCDAVEVWVKEGSDKHFRCSVARSRRTPLEFVLIPCSLGEEKNQAPPGGRGLHMERVCSSVIMSRRGELYPHLTERGSYWTDGSGDSTQSNGVAGANRLPPDADGSQAGTGGADSYRSIAIIPVRLEEECIGLLQLKSSQPGVFSAHDIHFYEEISAILGVALSHQYARIELRERIKEITCLYEIARVMAQPGISFAGVVQSIADLLPPAWLYPEIACARIVLNGDSYTTNGYRESPHRLVSDIVVDKEKVGFVEVAYLEHKIDLDEGPFLVEERSLIDNVAREVAGFYEWTQAEKAKASLEDQLRHADRLATIGQLAAGVAHELNEPLGNILGFAQLAKKVPELPVHAAKYLHNIETASLNARNIIKKLMAFARQLPPKKVRVDLNAVLSESISFFEGRCAKAGIHLERRLSGDLPPVTVDPGQIIQVLVNLVVNAIQAMPGGGTLTIETGAVEKGVCLSIEDTGTGDRNSSSACRSRMRQSRPGERNETRRGERTHTHRGRFPGNARASGAKPEIRGL